MIDIVNMMFMDSAEQSEAGWVLMMAFEGERDHGVLWRLGSWDPQT